MMKEKSSSSTSRPMTRSHNRSVSANAAVASTETNIGNETAKPTTEPATRNPTPTPTSPPSNRRTPTPTDKQDRLEKLRKAAAERQRRFRERMDEATRQRYKERDALNKRMKREQPRYRTVMTPTSRRLVPVLSNYASSSTATTKPVPEMKPYQMQSSIIYPRFVGHEQQMDRAMLKSAPPLLEHAAEALAGLATSVPALKPPHLYCNTLSSYSVGATPLTSPLTSTFTSTFTSTLTSPLQYTTHTLPNVNPQQFMSPTNPHFSTNPLQFTSPTNPQQFTNPTNYHQMHPTNPAPHFTIHSTPLHPIQQPTTTTSLPPISSWITAPLGSMTLNPPE